MPNNRLIPCFISLALGGCLFAAPQPPAILSEDRTMKAIYEEHVFAPPEPLRATAARARAPADPERFTRSAENELSGLFPLLPNPGLCMYVWPHLGGEGFPVPGYTTCFKMYERDEYALPGKVW